VQTTANFEVAYFKAGRTKVFRTWWKATVVIALPLDALPSNLTASAFCSSWNAYRYIWKIKRHPEAEW